METVLITGGTGFVGTHLTELLIKEGFNVTHLSRSVKGNEKVKTYQWDTVKGSMDHKAVENADYIIHLAGANIAGSHWSKKRKKLIIDSRVRTAEMLFNNIKTQPEKLKAFISASGVGYYGALTSEHIFKETDPPADDFTAITCRLWEKAADNFQTIGKRVVKIRTAIALGPDGGALPTMTKPVKFGIGSGLGTGKQYLPWIHIDDLTRIYLKAIIDTNMEGAYNAVAPEHLTNEEFMQTIAKVLKKPFFMPNVPVFVMKLILGEMGNAVLEGSRVSGEKIKNAGFKFKFTELEPALRDALKK
jgi:uncharacterized protein